MSIVGHLDSLHNGIVQGWAYDTDGEHTPLQIEVMQGSKVLATGVASEFRADVKAAGYGDGMSGFSISSGADDGDLSCYAAGCQLPTTSSTDAKAKKAGDFWDTISDWRPKLAPRARWNQSPQIVRDHNLRTCGRVIEGDPNRGVIELLRDIAPGIFPVRRAVSVGCGDGVKELLLVKEGLVAHFDLFDVSATALARGRSVAVQWGVVDKVNFIHGTNYQRQLGTGYDMVYWDNALHHMFDARGAVQWSYDVLNPGGWFVMADFVGANRFQWPNEAIAIADLVRSSLPEGCFVNPMDPGTTYSRNTHCPTLQEMEYDPSEAADSEAIIPAIEAIFPNPIIRHVGGTVYHLAISDVLTNIPDGSVLLEYLINLDRSTSYIPHYAAAVAQKPAP